MSVGRSDERRSMRKYDGTERRTNGAQNCDLFVEVAVNYCRTIGRSEALSYLLERGVPANVAARVTSPEGVRRLTLWEQHFDEAALRQALGARPLLPSEKEHRPRSRMLPNVAAIQKDQGSFLSE